MTKNYQAEIVAVGTELLLGQIANTNAQWLSEQLATYGINVYNHTVVGDNLERVEQAFRLAQSRSDIVIVTGGLGPTEDDLTREGFEQLTGLEILEDKTTMEKIESYFKERGRTMTPNNRKQARVFKGASVLKNNAGMAPGMHVDYQDTHWFFLPGVPREMKQISSEELFPFLENLTGKQQVIQSTVLKFIGIGESNLEHELTDMIHGQTNPTIAPLAQDQGVVIRVTASASSKEEAQKLVADKKQEVLERIGEYCFGEDEQTIENKVIELLAEKEKTIGAAESLTGGLFSSNLVSAAGASNVFAGSLITYQTSAKEALLDLSPEWIAEYGVVSKECAEKMAEQAALKLNTPMAISFTGVAGPDTQEEKPVGQVYIAIFDEGKIVESSSILLSGSRNNIRERAALKGFELLYQYLK
ncbi:competence/damage-inducible protein A [Oceanobacillus neutriphilus]|uniref:Putative competence-damage inducible protein n=1 Tax=Oceanobacillus neutriphilus TaxID=531815 RepID=A0ABQ2NWR8_9BACI|nr:competence/damage-inducible protein A [Oceanobacillus neutriphilus]GGP12495.1 putative competence-damage inducible protein [Oceanobacillus neutriphilus]